MSDAKLTKTLCRFLATIDGWAYEHAYLATDQRVALFYGAIQAAPDRAVGVRVYGDADDRAAGLYARRVQLRFRGGKRASDGADELASVAFAALNELSRWGGLLGATRLSLAPLGADSNGREERSDNYIITIDNPEE